MKVLAQLNEDSKRTYVNPFEIALIYLALGKAPQRSDSSGP